MVVFVEAIFEGSSGGLGVELVWQRPEPKVFAAEGDGSQIFFVTSKTRKAYDYGIQ